jgi:hypothetical protein
LTWLLDTRPHGRIDWCGVGWLDRAYHRWALLRGVPRLYHRCGVAASPSCTKRKLISHENAGHVVPEARLGGPIALIRDGDRVVIDSEKRTIDWDVSEEEQARRRVEWEGSGKGTLTVKRGILLRYARDVAVRNVSVPPGFSG